MKARHLRQYMEAVEALRPVLEALEAFDVELTVDVAGMVRLQFKLPKGDK